MSDPSVVKVYVLTVQSILAPTGSQARRRTHDFQETFGAAFYETLRAEPDLVVIADEYHEYRGPRFSTAISELGPKVTIGLTATPFKDDEADVVYRYPLAAAIAQRWVKVPVVLGRPDDRDDVHTRLADGLAVLEYKRTVAAREADRLGRRINPIMLVVASDTTEADGIAATIRDPSFADGRYTSGVLVVHSKVKEEDEPAAFERLAAVEDPESAVRVVVSVGMLKVGWDVKNVYVLMSTRPSLSSVLTEQVLGRGLRLPYGRWVEPGVLNTLDVVAHEQYAKLLERAGVLNEQFVSHITRARVARDAMGRQVLVRDVEEVSAPAAVAEGQTAGPGMVEAPTPAGSTDGQVTVQVASVSTRTGRAAAEPVPHDVARREPAVQVLLPVLTLRPQVAEFSLTDLTDKAAFRQLGRSVAAAPDRYLRRVALDATVSRDADGTIRSHTRTREMEDRIESSSVRLDVVAARMSLVDAVAGSDTASARVDLARQERAAAGEIVDAFLEGLNGDAETLLAAYLDRARSRLVRAVDEARRNHQRAPQYEPLVSFVAPDLRRSSGRPTSDDWTTRLSRSALVGTAFTGSRRSVFVEDWFDSHPERDLAVLLDSPANPVSWWLRLRTGDLPIRCWTGPKASTTPTS
ncbi:MAG: DEAD/DEAH box helicase family protein [Cellulomonas sp.]|nr:DEAD/DEAH box helicase family protein [Cellulomonas sp.]